MPYPSWTGGWLFAIKAPFWLHCPGLFYRRIVNAEIAERGAEVAEKNISLRWGQGLTIWQPEHADDLLYTESIDSSQRALRPALRSLRLEKKISPHGRRQFNRGPDDLRRGRRQKMACLACCPSDRSLAVIHASGLKHD